MAKTKIVNEDGSQVEGEKFREIWGGIRGAIGDKDEVVADIRERYGHAKDKGLNKPALQQAIKWAGAGVEAYIDHAATVVQYLYAAQNQVAQLDLFREAVSRPIFRPEPPKNPVEAAERMLDEGSGTMRPIGEVAQTVVETVGEMVRQNDAAKAVEPPSEDEVKEAERDGAAAYDKGGDISKPPKFRHELLLKGWDRGFTKRAQQAREERSEAVTQDQQLEAKLQGEAAGREARPATDNPYPVTHALHTWWSKGWHLGDEARKRLAEENAAAGPPAESDNVTPLAGRTKGGFKDKTPRMSAKQAAALLGGGDGDAA